VDLIDEVLGLAVEAVASGLAGGTGTAGAMGDGGRRRSTPGEEAVRRRHPVANGRRVVRPVRDDERLSGA